MASLTVGESAHRYPQFLPDGHHFLYLSLGVNGQTGLYVGSSHETREKAGKFLTRASNSAVYASPGYLLSVDGNTLFSQRFDAGALKTSGQPSLIAEHVGHTSTYKSAISTSATGVIAYAGTLSPKGSLTWFDQGGRPLDSTGPEGYYTDFRLSPNEKLLAASLLDTKTGVIEVWITDLARGSHGRVGTANSALDASPVWSPDAAQFVFRTNRGVVEFYQRSAAGGGSEQAVLSYPMIRAAGIQTNMLIITDWSPDGKNIIFSAQSPSSGTDLWLLPLTGDRKPVKFLTSSADEMHGNFSPDSRLIAYTSNDSGKFQVNVQTLPLSDKKWQVSTKGGYEPRWRADGREIYYLSDDRKLMAVPVGPGPSFGAPRVLFQTRVQPGVTTNRTHYVPSRDGRRFLVNTQNADAPATPITVVMNWAARLNK